MDAGHTQGPGALDLTRLIHDLPIPGGAWYTYAPDNHLLTPKNQSHMVRDTRGGSTRFVAFRPVSYYDPQTAQSGRFTLAVSTFSSSWSAEQTWLTSRFISADAPLCLDLFTQTEVDCAGNSWQLALRVYSRMVPDGPLLVGEPGFFIPSVVQDINHQPVRLATFAGIQDLALLPTPNSVTDLEDHQAAGWELPSWQQDVFSVQLPEAGMVLGSRYVAPGYQPRDDVYLYINARRKLIKFEVKPIQPDNPWGGMRFRWAVGDLNLETLQAENFGAIQSLDVSVPTQMGTRVWLSLDQANPMLDGSTATPYLPLSERTWDLSVLPGDDGVPRIALSLSCALGNLRELLGRNDLTLESALQ